MSELKMEFLCIVDWGCSHCATLQAAAIHFEKVARREIGVFTTPKNRSRSKLMAPPPSGKEPEKGYSRVPISYSILDSTGHCFQVNWTLDWKRKLNTAFESTQPPWIPITLRCIFLLTPPFPWGSTGVMSSVLYSMADCEVEMCFFTFIHVLATGQRGAAQRECRQHTEHCGELYVCRHGPPMPFL